MTMTRTSPSFIAERQTRACHWKNTAWRKSTETATRRTPSRIPSSFSRRVNVNSLERVKCSIPRRSGRLLQPLGLVAGVR
jgi:hypothetical protein